MCQKLLQSLSLGGLPFTQQSLRILEDVLIIEAKCAAIWDGSYATLEKKIQSYEGNLRTVTCINGCLYCLASSGNVIKNIQMFDFKFTIPVNRLFKLGHSISTRGRVQVNDRRLQRILKLMMDDCKGGFKFSCIL